MSLASHFLGDRILFLAFTVAFASGLSQLEMFSGDCGISPSMVHLPLVVTAVSGFLLSTALLYNSKVFGVLLEYRLRCALPVLYCAFSLGLNGYDIPLCDRMLIEGGILSVIGWNGMLYKMLLIRIILSVGFGKFLNGDCDGSWYTFSSLKSDVLNQPFPFTPVWHIAQLPDWVTVCMSVVIVLVEILFPCILFFAREGSIVEATAGMGIIGLALVYYSLVGNFNWSTLLVVSYASRFVPSELAALVLGEKTFVRWGFISASFKEEVAETKLIQILAMSATLSGILAGLVVTCNFLLGNNLLSLRDGSIPFRTGLSLCLWGMTLLGITTLFRTRRGCLIVGCLGLLLSKSEWLSLLTFGRVQFNQDYTSLPTCYTFTPADNFPGHTRDGRAGFLFQTRYSQVGTNTIGNDLGGTKYAELSVPGLVHGDEQRPPFLLGHFPRMALKIWLMGTGRKVDIQEGLALMDKLAHNVRQGSDAIRVFFPDTDDSVLSAHIGRSNQIQSFYQQYRLTNRAADHQWWKRSYDKVSALPASDHFTESVDKLRCTTVVPVKVFNVSLELFLILSALGTVAAKLLLSSGRSSGGTISKKK